MVVVCIKGCTFATLSESLKDTYTFSHDLGISHDFQIKNGGRKKSATICEKEPGKRGGKFAPKKRLCSIMDDYKNAWTKMWGEVVHGLSRMFGQDVSTAVAFLPSTRKRLSLTKMSSLCVYAVSHHVFRDILLRSLFLFPNDWTYTISQHYKRKESCDKWMVYGFDRLPRFLPAAIINALLQ